MNAGQIVSLGRVYLNDPDGRIWTDAELYSWMNDSITKLTIGSEATQKKFILPLTDGTRSYSLPDDCYEVRGVRINGQKAFQTSDQELEELDTRYLEYEARPEWYYLEDIQTIAFYPVPSVTADTTTFDSEYGVVVQYTDSGTDATFTSEYGTITDALDTSGANQFIVDGMVGETVAIDDGAYVAVVAYVQQPADVSISTDTPNLPEYMHYAVLYGMLSSAFGAERQGQNKKLARFFDERFKDLEKQFFALHVEEERGQDQFPSQTPVSWGSDLDMRMRVWP